MLKLEQLQETHIFIVVRNRDFGEKIASNLIGYPNVTIVHSVFFASQR